MKLKGISIFVLAGVMILGACSQDEKNENTEPVFEEVNAAGVSEEELSSLTDKIQEFVYQEYAGEGYVKLVYSKPKIIIYKEAFVSEDTEDEHFYLKSSEQVSEVSNDASYEYKDGVLKEGRNGVTDEEGIELKSEEVEEKVGELVEEVKNFKTKYFEEFKINDKMYETGEVLYDNTVDGLIVKYEYVDGVSINAHFDNNEEIEYVSIERYDENNVFISSLIMRAKE